MPYAYCWHQCQLGSQPPNPLTLPMIRAGGRPARRTLAWRDCDDLSAEVYAGRRPKDDDALTDSNCNGIKGVDVASWAGPPPLLWRRLQAEGTLASSLAVAHATPATPPRNITCAGPAVSPGWYRQCRVSTRPPSNVSFGTNPA